MWSAGSCAVAVVSTIFCSFFLLGVVVGLAPACVGRGSPIVGLRSGQLGIGGGNLPQDDDRGAKGAGRSRGTFSLAGSRPATGGSSTQRSLVDALLGSDSVPQDPPSIGAVLALLRGVGGSFPDDPGAYDASLEFTEPAHLSLKERGRLMREQREKDKKAGISPRERRAAAAGSPYAFAWTAPASAHLLFWPQVILGTLGTVYALRAYRRAVTTNPGSVSSAEAWRPGERYAAILAGLSPAESAAPSPATGAPGVTRRRPVALHDNTDSPANAATPATISAGVRPAAIPPVRWCEKCSRYKPLRAFHCRDCGECVLGMDHHCPWINNCVGHANRKAFVQFLCAAAAMLAYLALLALHANIRVFRSFLRRATGIMTILGMTTWILLIVGLVFALCALALFQFRILGKNESTKESHVKANYQRHRRIVDRKRATGIDVPEHEELPAPPSFSRGSWRANVADVMGHSWRDWVSEGPIPPFDELKWERHTEIDMSVATV
jgi:DHHC palmitoyltransferase